MGRSVAMAAGAVLGPAIAAAKTFSSMGDSMGKMSKRTGVAVEELSQLKFAAEQSGSSAETLEKGLLGMAKSLNDASRGLTTKTAALEKLGLEYKDLAGLSPEDQFITISDAISKMESPTGRAAQAMEIFGRAGKEMLPMLNSGADGIRALMKEAHAAGLTMSTEDAQAAEKFTDEMNKLLLSVKMAVFSIGSALAPVLENFGVTVRDNLKPIREWIAANGDTIRQGLKVAAIAAAVGVALIALGAILGAVGTILGAVAAAVGFLGSALTFLAAHPIIAVLGAITVAAIAVAAAFGKAGQASADLADKYSTLRKENDDARATDKLRMELLQQLAKVENKNARQIKQASTLISTLTGRYGDLGVSIDKTTGKISGMTAAQGKFNAAMKAAAIADVKADLVELRQNAGRLHDELMDDSTFGSEKERTAWEDSIKGRFKTNSAKQRAAVMRLRALTAGDDSALVGAGKSDATKLREDLARAKATNNAPSEAAEKAANDAAEAMKALAALDEKAAARSRTALETKIHAIAEETKERQRLIDLMIEGEKVREDGTRADVIKSLQLERNAAGVAGEDDKNQARLDAAETAAKKIAEVEKTKRNDRLAAEKTLAQDVARLKIEANLKGHKKTMALIDLEEKQAIAAAELTGVGVGLVKQKYDLRRQIAEAGQQVADSRSVSNVGMFRTGGRLGDLSGGDMAQRQTKAAEKGAKNLDKLVAMAENGDLAIATV